MLTYAAVVGLVVSAILTAVGQLTAPYRQANQQAQEARSVLQVLGVPVVEGIGARDLVALYQQTVSEERRGDLLLYRYNVVCDTGTEPGAYAVRFEGQGLWGPIEGVLAVESDLRTLRGISFYVQEETPGLGGEIASPRFREQFVGKSIIGVDGVPGLRIVKPGTAGAVNEVDAITGATLTSGRVETMLNQCIRTLVENTPSADEGSSRE